MADYRSNEPLEHRFLPHTIQQQYEYHPPPPPLDRTSSSSSSSQLHSVRKLPSKPWRTNTKPAVCHHVPGAGDSRPSASPPKVYRVDPRGFRQLVQKLTGAGTATNHQPVPQQRRLRDAAPAPLQLFHQAPVAVQNHHQQQIFLPAQPQYPAPYPSAVMSHPQGKPAAEVGTADDNDTVTPATYAPLPQQQQSFPSPPAAKMSTSCQSPGDWAALLSPSIVSAWCSFPLLSPGSMTPIETSTVN